METDRAELVLRDEDKNNYPAVMVMDPKFIVTHATDIANVAADIINKKGLYKEIQGRRHIIFEGWTLLAKLANVSVREKYVKELPDGGYEVGMDLIDRGTGNIIGGHSHICGVDEKRWKTADKYARRSMAATRAASKTLRIELGWMLTLAGYRPDEITPAEEMEDGMHRRDLREELKQKHTYDKADIAHKRQLVELCKSIGVTDVPVLTKVNEMLHGKPLDNIADHVQVVLKDLNQKGELNG